MKPHFRLTTHMDVALEDSSKNLIENLHLRWGYALMHVDKYFDDENDPVTVVYGSRKISDNEYYSFRVELVAEHQWLAVEVKLWKHLYRGWPFVNAEGHRTTIEFSDWNSRMRRVGEEIFLFCEKPHEQAGGITGFFRALLNFAQRHRRSYKP